MDVSGRKTPKEEEEREEEEEEEEGDCLLHLLLCYTSSVY